LARAVPAMRAQIDAEEAAPQGKACGTAQAEPGCAVAVHYQAWVLRSVAPAAVFRSMILAFALADKDPRFVGVNIVAPEDWPVARADYDLHMAMFRFLAQRHPGVAVSMHAGELAFGRCRRPILPIISPRRWLRGAADRPWCRHRLEDQGRATMARMAREGVAVEINLSSNAVILGVKGAEHPFELYRRHGVPVVLATDDAGVLRIDLTHEYQRACSEHGLGYADLKASRARARICFAPGASLWNAHHAGLGPCLRDGKLTPPACRTLLAAARRPACRRPGTRFARFEKTRSRPASSRNT
jgi:adenosine deaminase